MSTDIILGELMDQATLDHFCTLLRVEGFNFRQVILLEIINNDMIRTSREIPIKDRNQTTEVRGQKTDDIGLLIVDWKNKVTGCACTVRVTG